MPRYSFQISNGESFGDIEELPDDDAACQQALLTVRDIETALAPKGGEWSIVMMRDEKTVFRIDVSARRLG